MLKNEVIATRQQLQAEFIDLRNSQFKRPAPSNKRIRNQYYDWLADSDKLAELKSDDELLESINNFKNKSK